ncbi:uncharacterized protein LOC6573941 [Drosophila mojavensis]|uniref:Uncharacterized protein, isoform B n=1 Tax=Drosophila mojavensis TaxID=7230 RepID=B4K8P2_DROMO|nr:uncharacterized protein LOC6573941 [Drosophila mojavensis]XP_015022679.1 uncharacterized protein LOC6573941 [Drosophila mojavensis]XP_015022680.1 uncharacterized protein LOC6573941 [Drosophila mojavensis]XP_043864191.1 uncharacterized protein LOC6573941 [Drosophila mojavensis]EDW15461.2 uncharacterized protein Dmoj_GI22773, isoform D [Drosophila mojavensis]KRG01573.1 uncharacterized protein Dmoj_GI22773, isoform B [Drosophila mojavensis]KRG01574.1 uncharacterized protein Dmoj_GI22773, isof
MFLFYNRRIFVIILIEFLLLLLSDDNGQPTLTKLPTTVAAATQSKNSTTLKPYIQIKKHAVTRLTITNPNATHLLHCNPIINPYDYYQDGAPIYCSWYRNGEAIEHLAIRNNQFFIYKNGTLRLPPNERISGVYHCLIESDDMKVISDSITVEYPVLKRLVLGPQQSANVSVQAEGNLVLGCPFFSVPAARISWYFGNESLANDSSAFILSNGTLIVRKVRQEQAGKYKCVAKNQYASRTHRQFVWLVRVEPNTSGPQPLATTTTHLLPAFQNATLFVPTGGSLQLQCHAMEDYVPIEWWLQHPNNSLSQLSNNSMTLEITNASMARHEGYYMCTTPTDRQTFRVIVTIPPRIVSSLPVELGYISLSTTLSCRAEGNPEPTLSWYHNGAPLNSSYTRYISGNELYIHSFDPEEEGIYQCFARNVAGEDSVTGEMRFKHQLEQPNPLQNIRCYPHSFHTINVTFDSRTLESMFVVHIVRSNPHQWSSFAPMKLNHTSFVVISTGLPIYRPFALITRFLLPTSEVRSGSIVPQQMMISSLRSPAVVCCTQGLLLRLVHLGNDTFVKWSQAELDNKKYFILQFSINHTHPHPAQLLDGPLHGTVTAVEEKPDEVRRQLTIIRPLNQSAAATVLRNAEHEVLDNEVDDLTLEIEEDIFSLVVDANVTGLLLHHFTRIKMRVLIITSENEYLAQDFRYVQWKIIENGTSDQANMSFRLITVESRMLAFQFLDSLNDTCVYECHLHVQLPLRKQEPKCKERTIVNSVLLVSGLSANERYNFHFYNCKPQIFYGEMDVQTLPDPPGTISNSRVVKHNGLKLIWEPPLHPNGRVHHYNILWTLGNVTHEANVLECRPCFYKFPNVSETDKIHVAVRVVGETGVGAPMFFDLINHHILETVQNSSNHEVYSGIAIGSLLSMLCVFGFALFIIFQRRRFKARVPGPTHLTTPTDINFGNLSSASGIPGDSAGGLSGNTMQQDCHEMQTLIPRSRYHIELLPERTLEYQTSTATAAALPNGNGNGNGNGTAVRRADQEAQLELTIAGVHNLSQLPLCASSPERKTVQDAMLQEAKAFYIPYRHTPPNAVALQAGGSSNSNASHKQSSSKNSDSGLEVAVPPNSLPLVATVPGLGRRSGSLSSSSASSTSNGSKKQFHTNFARHSNSNDGICLLAEEESAATLTPTSEHEYACVSLTNGFKLPAEMTKQMPSKSQFSNNNNSSSSSSSNHKSTVVQQKDRHQQPMPQQYPSASIVPVNGPQTHSVGVKSKKTTTMAKQAWPASTALNRRAQVDPNG